MLIRKQKLKEQIECLDKSLYEKWDVLDPTTEEGWDDANVVSNCACCRAYLQSFSKCHGCPIAEDTGKEFCGETPFDEIVNANFDDTTAEEREEYFEKERQYLRDLKSKLENKLKRLNGD